MENRWWKVKKMKAGFTNTEEALVQLTDVVPFLVENLLKKTAESTVKRAISKNMRSKTDCWLPDKTGVLRKSSWIVIEQTLEINEVGLLANKMSQWFFAFGTFSLLISDFPSLKVHLRLIYASISLQIITFAANWSHRCVKNNILIISTTNWNLWNFSGWFISNEGYEVFRLQPHGQESICSVCNRSGFMRCTITRCFWRWFG